MRIPLLCGAFSWVSSNGDTTKLVDTQFSRDFAPTTPSLLAAHLDDHDTLEMGAYQKILVNIERVHA